MGSVLPARSVAVAEGVQVIPLVLAAVVGVPLGVPRVIVIVDPLITIVELEKLMFEPV